MLNIEYEAYLAEKKEYENLEKDTTKNNKPEYENSEIMDSLYNNRPTGD